VATSTQAGAPDGVDAGLPPHANLALVVIATAQLMVVLDATIVNIALPHIHSALGFSATGLSWVLSSYTLVFGGLLLLGGRTGDLFGRRRMFIIGVSVFAAASLAGGFAQSQGFLIAMRCLQGVGAAIASPTALSLLTTTFPQGPARNRAFGVYAAVSGTGAALGLLLGGILTDLLSWRWVFFVNAPIGLALALAAPRVIRESERMKAHLDVPGAVTSTLGMTSLVYGFIYAATNGWGSGRSLLAFVAAAIFLASFVVIESHTASPLMPLRLFRSRSRVGSYLVMLILGASVFATFYFLSQYVQTVKGFSPLRAGLCFLPISAVVIVMAQVASRLIVKVGAQSLIIAGTLSAGFGLYILSSLTPYSSYVAHVLPAIALIGTGMGCIFVPVTLTAVSGVDPQDAGIASAMLNVSQQIGGAVGLSALVAVFSAAARRDLRSHAGVLHGTTLEQHVFTAGADAAFRAGSFFMLVGLVVALVLVTSPTGHAEIATPEAAAT
jgi:EmrB/QacA subfamily drug resistance transporter